MIYVHNLSPFALQFTEHFGIRWYGLAYLTGILAGYYAAVWMIRRGGTYFKEEQIGDFATYVAIGVLAGGRLGYCLFYSPDLFTSFDGHFPYWGVLKVNEGGMASHGGILGVLLVSYLYSRRHEIPFWHCQDLTVFGGALGFFFGRIANFINGELYGREAPADWPFAVKFPGEMNLWAQHQPDRLTSLGPAVDALQTVHLDGGGTVPVTAAIWQQWLKAPFDALSRQHIYETIESLVTAVQAHNEKVTAALAPVLTPRYPSQLYQAVLEGLLVFLALAWIWRKPQKPAVIAAWFGTLYCSARIVGEQFRMPDSQIGFQWLGLTRGQWLSVAMLVVAILLLIWAYRRNVPKVAGWYPSGPAPRGNLSKR